MPEVIVYLCRHRDTGKSYVGITCQGLNKRINQHRTLPTAQRQAFHHAIHLHGWESFTVEILERCADRSQAMQAEVHWIGQLGSLAPGGYNLTRGGDGVIDPSPELRLKMGAKNIGRKHTEEWKRAASERNKGRRWTDEMRIKLANINLGRVRSLETRKLIGDAQRGKIRNPHSEKTRAKIALAKNGVPLSPEHRAATSLGMMCKKPSVETREKLRVAQQARRAQERSRLM